MDNKLTAQISGAYFGCNFIYYYTSLTSGKPDSIGYENKPFWLYMNQQNIGDCKLILTPLSKISDEHKSDVAIILFGNKAIERIGDLDAAFHAGKFIEKLYKTPLQCDRILQIFDYLRSKGYDCGHGPIPSLIQAGIAIDSTTL